MNNKLLISLLFISGMFLQGDAFAISEIASDSQDVAKTEDVTEIQVQQTTNESVSDTQVNKTRFKFFSFINKKEKNSEQNVAETKNVTSGIQQDDVQNVSNEIKEAEIQKNAGSVDSYPFVDNIDYNNDVHSDFSLEDCIRIALKHNLSIQSSTINQSIYKEDIGLAWKKYFPELAAGVNWQKAREHSVGDYTTAFMPQVSANMTVFDFGKAKAYSDSAKSTYKSKVLDTSEQINLIICNTKKAYYNLLFANAQYAVYQDTVADFELQKQQAFSLYSAGKKAKVDVAIADYNLCKAKLNFEKAKNILKVAKYELSHVMGYPEYTNYDLTSELNHVKHEISVDEAIETAFKVRPELLAAEKTMEAARLNLRAKKRAFTPEININATYGNNVGNYAYGSYGFGANLNYSNFNILETKKLINKARHEYEKSKIDFDERKHDLFLSVNKAYENYVTAEESIEIARNALEQAKEQYRQTKGRYKAGIADIIELKDGENAYLNARLDYYNSLLNFNISLAEFEKEVGSPIDNSLGVVNQN